MNEPIFGGARGGGKSIAALMASVRAEPVAEQLQREATALMMSASGKHVLYVVGNMRSANMLTRRFAEQLRMCGLPHCVIGGLAIKFPRTNGQLTIVDGTRLDRVWGVQFDALLHAPLAP